MGNFPRCLLAVRVTTGITLTVVLVVVISSGVDGSHVIFKTEKKTSHLQNKEENKVRQERDVPVLLNSPAVSPCGRHDSSDCVVNANSTNNCTCEIDLTFDACRATQLKSITLEVGANATKPSERVVPYRVLDDVTIELHIQEDEANVYNIFCSTEDGFHLVGTPTYTVNVGYPPMDVIDFHCVSYNWEELICRWKKPYNPAQGSDNNNKYQPYLNNILECGNGRDCLYTGGDTGSTKDCCYWNTTMGYRPDFPSLAMVFLVKNALTTERVQFRKPIDYLGVVLPNPVENFTATPEDSTTVLLTWDTPDALVSFPADLVYRIKYKLSSPYGTNFYWYPPISGNCSLDNCHRRMQVDFPGMDYKLELELRSGAANFTMEDDEWWSNASKQEFTTPPERPWSAPAVASGTYQVQMTSSVSNVYDLILEWQLLNFTQFNGPDFHYVITAMAHGNMTVTKNATALQPYVEFKNMSQNVEYKIEVRGVNMVGESNVSSIVHIPVISSMPEMPALPAVIHHTDMDVYNLTWQGSDKLAYTIYLCFDNADTRGPCQGMLYWKHVGHKTSVNVTLAEFNVTESLDSSPRFAVSAEDEEDRSSGMNWDCCVHPQPYGIINDVQPVIRETTGVTESEVVIRWSVSCESWGSVVEFVRVEYCPGQFEFVTNCSGTVPSQIGPIVTSARDCLNSLPLSGLKANTTYSIWITLLFQGNRSSLRSSNSKVVTSPIVVKGLETWEIILIVIGCLAAVAVILTITWCAQRKWEEIKKQLNQEPNVPVGLSSDVGGPPGYETKRNSDRDQSRRGRSSQRSAVFTENEMKKDSLPTIFSEVVKDCFKSSPPTPDEETLLSSRGHSNRGYEDTSLKRFHEPNSASSSGTSEVNSNTPNSMGDIDTESSGPESMNSYASVEDTGYTEIDRPSATTQGYVAPDTKGLIPIPISGYTKMEDVLTNESDTQDTMNYENAREEYPNNEINSTSATLNSGYVLPDIVNMDPGARSGYVREQDANDIITNPKSNFNPRYVTLDNVSNDSTTKPGYACVENAQSIILTPTSTLAPGYVALNDVHIDPDNERLEETKSLTVKPTSVSAPPYVTADEMSLRVAPKSGYVLAEDANTLFTVPSSVSTPVHGSSADESLETKFGRYGKMEDANNPAEETEPALNKGNVLSDNINTNNLGQLVATSTSEIQKTSKETSKTNPGSGYLSVEDANMIAGQLESAQTTSNVIPEHESLKAKPPSGYVCMEDANKFATTPKPSSTPEHHVSPKETIKSTPKPGYISTDDAEKLMTTGASASNPSFAGLQDVRCKTESKPGYVSVEDAEKLVPTSLSTPNPNLKDTSSDETVFQDKLPYGYSRVSLWQL